MGICITYEPVFINMEKKSKQTIKRINHGLSFLDFFCQLVLYMSSASKIIKRHYMKKIDVSKKCRFRHVYISSDLF